NASGDVANLTNTIAGDQSITLDAAITVGTLTLGASGASGSYTISNGPGGSLTFTSGSAINVAGSRNQTVNADVVIAGGTLTVTNNTAGTLTVGGPVAMTGSLPVAGTAD